MQMIHYTEDMNMHGSDEMKLRYLTRGALALGRNHVFFSLTQLEDTEPRREPN